MSLILSIDTALENGSVCLSKSGEIIKSLENQEQKNHASFVQPAIKQIIKDSGLELKDLDAIAVTHGPGSYTGLRVGLSSAKGLCYALDKPLILINTLEAIALSGIESLQSTSSGLNNIGGYLVCPMIDARRMEVFTAVYDSKLSIIIPPSAMIVEEASFLELLEVNKIIFLGNGATKFKSISTHRNAYFTVTTYNCTHLATLAYRGYNNKEFGNVPYSEPLYLKDFFSSSH
jgi:tRNA threonylcarbamoyladenosine biosynthesis protein TsaB